MQNEEVQKLLAKYIAGQCSETEKALIEDWYAQFNEEEIDISPDRISEWGEDIYHQLPGNDRIVKRLRPWLRTTGVAACILFMLGLWVHLHSTRTILKANYVNVIKPGTNKAILTLANGRTINLSNAKTGIVIDANKLIYNDGTNIINTADHHGIQLISTPKGGQYQIILADGSKVWLNAASSLKFPQSFAGLANRTVELSGEAYFEVAKDRVHPFIVKSKFQELQVLGTHFNVSAYDEEANTKSTLLEGSIRINKNVLLKPGEQAVNTGTAIQVKQVDTDNAVAWKNGEFMFREEPLANIMRKIARWYDVTVVYEDQQLGKKLFGGEISRFTNVSEVLNMLELTGQVHFKIDGRRVMVLK